MQRNISISVPSSATDELIAQLEGHDEVSACSVSATRRRRGCATHFREGTSVLSAGRLRHDISIGNPARGSYGDGSHAFTVVVAILPAVKLSQGRHRLSHSGSWPRPMPEETQCHAVT